MECRKVKELLPFYGDGSLDRDEEKDVREHLEGCPACRREYEEQKNVVDIVRGAVLSNQPDAVPGYLGLVRRKIEAKKRARIFYFRVAAAAAVLLLTVSVALFGFMRFQTGRPVANDFAATDISLDMEELLTNHQLDEYDIGELMGVDEETERQIMMDALLSGSIVDVTPEDIMEMMDDDQLETMLVSYGR